jgi:hypothetical protein
MSIHKRRRLLVNQGAVRECRTARKMTKRVVPASHNTLVIARKTVERTAERSKISINTTRSMTLMLTDPGWRSHVHLRVVELV